MIDQVLCFEYETKHKKPINVKFVVGSGNVGCCHCKKYGECSNEDGITNMLPICTAALDYYEQAYHDDLCVTPLVYYNG